MITFSDFNQLRQQQRDGGMVRPPAVGALAGRAASPSTRPPGFQAPRTAMPAPGMPPGMPGSAGTSPAAARTAYPTLPGAQVGSIVPGQGLRGTSITAGAAPAGGVDLAAQRAEAQTAALAALRNLGATPDRQQLATQTYDQFLQRQAPQAQAQSRAIAQRAASMGRQGSGMTTNDYGDLDLALERERGQTRSELATQTAGSIFNDNLQRVNAAQGLGNAFQGWQQGDRTYEGQLRDEARGERAYEDGLEQQGYDRQRDQTLVGDQLQNSALQRALSAQGAGNPAQLIQALQGQGAQYGAQAGAGATAGSSLLQQWAYESARRRAQTPTG